MFAGKKSAQIREILISESAWEEMTCLFAPSLIDLSPDNDLAKITKSLRTAENRMVCVIQDNNRILRWDRSYASRAKNHWRKVAPDRFEILGTVEHIHYVGKC
nr:pilus assembly protein PilI [Escherichia coli]